MAIDTEFIKIIPNDRFPIKIAIGTDGDLRVYGYRVAWYSSDNSIMVFDDKREPYFITQSYDRVLVQVDVDSDYERFDAQVHLNKSIYKLKFLSLSVTNAPTLYITCHQANFTLKDGKVP